MYYGRARGAPRTFVWMAFSVLRIVLFTRCEWGHLPGYHDSLFIIHHSLLTDIKIIGMLSAGFSIGGNNAAEAAISGGCCQTPPSANADTSPFRGGLRRASALGAITPKKPRSAACAWLIGRASPTAPEGNRQRGLPARREMPAGAPRRSRSAAGAARPLRQLTLTPPLSGEACGGLQHWGQ